MQDVYIATCIKRACVCQGLHTSVAFYMRVHIQCGATCGVVLALCVCHACRVCVIHKWHEYHMRLACMSHVRRWWLPV